MSIAAGRRPLSAERVLDAAVQVADKQGIDALTMRRLAEVLDVHPTSIYNHLASKEAILAGLAERLIEEAALPMAFAQWQDWVRSFAVAMRRIALEHPGAFAVFTRVPATGETSTRHVEAALEAFRRAGFSAADARDAVSGVALAVMGLALNELPGAGPAPAVVAPERLPERYPRLSEALALGEPEPDTMWTLIIESLIRGLTPLR